MRGSITTISGVGGPSAAAGSPASVPHVPRAAWACSLRLDVNVFLHSLHSSTAARPSDPVLAAPRHTVASPPDMPTALVDLICLLVTLVGIAALRHRQQQFPK